LTLTVCSIVISVVAETKMILSRRLVSGVPDLALEPFLVRLAWRDLCHVERGSDEHFTIPPQVRRRIVRREGDALRELPTAGER
jgi:hypothetical protein